jgi:hypothetical protein
MNTEQQDAARSFREMGAALEDLGRRMGMGKLVTLGRRFAKVTPRETADERLSTLRRPVDELRALVDELATLTGDLRTVVDVLASVIGVDN